MAGVAAGEALIVLATDPEAQIDLAAWAAEEGHGYSERLGEGGTWTEFELLKAG
jgi:TusA-related sulfurtransferase